MKDWLLLSYFDPKKISSNKPSKEYFDDTYRSIYNHTFEMLTNSVYFNNVAKVMYKKFFVNNLEPVAKNFYDKIGPNIINYFSEHVFEDIFAVAFNEYLMESKYLSKRIRILADIIIAQNKNYKYIITGQISNDNGIIYGCRYSDLYKEMNNVDLFFCKRGGDNCWKPVTDKSGMYDTCELHFASDEKSESYVVNLKHELEKLAKHCILKFLEYKFVKFYIKDVANKNRKYLREIYTDIEAFRVRNASTLIEHTQKIIRNIENAICLDIRDEIFPTENLNIDILVYFITTLNEINIDIVNNILNGESYYKKLAKISDASTSWIAKNGSIYETTKSNILSMSVYSTNKLANTFIDPEVAQDLTGKVVSSLLPIIMTPMCDLYQLYDPEGEGHLNNQTFAKNIISFVLQSLKQEIAEKYNREKSIEYFDLVIDAFKNQQRIKIEKMIETTYPDETDEKLKDIKKKTMDRVNNLIDLICEYIMNHNKWCKELLNRWVDITNEKAVEYLDLKQIYRDLFSAVETAKNNYSAQYTHYSHYLDKIVDKYVII